MPNRPIRLPGPTAALRRAPDHPAMAVRPAAQEPTAVLLPGETDLEAFRREARALLRRGVAPAQVQWHVAGAATRDLFAAPDPALATEAAGAVPADAGARPAPAPFAVDLLGDPVGDAVPAPASAAPTAAGPADGLPLPASARVPPAFLLLCRLVVLHRDPGRFGLLYRLLWRLVHEPGLRHDPLDPDRMQALHMARAVRRDMHKMKAFVRFRTLHPPGTAAAIAHGDGLLHVAWFEPVHHIAAAVAPFFVRRFAGMRWAILTPDRSLRWDGARLDLGPGASKRDAPPADAGEALWLTYYAHIFNPARLKLATMQREMPRRYWRNLPEAALIAPLATQAAARTGRMLEHGPTVPARRIPPASLAPPASPDPLARNPGDTPAGTSPPTAPLRFLRPDGLDALRDAVERCRDCPIGACATRAVPGEGPARARLVLVGEQPGDQEDLRGRPFVGPAGQLLDRALRALGWERDALYLTNAVKHFKFEARGRRRIHQSPSAQEAAACRPWLEDELRLVQPAAIVALGATAARAVLGRPVAVRRERGRWLRDGQGRPVLVTLHPAALLRTDPADRAAAYDAWLDDLRQAAPHAVPDPGDPMGIPVDSAGTTPHLPTGR